MKTSSKQLKPCDPHLKWLHETNDEDETNESIILKLYVLILFFLMPLQASCSKRAISQKERIVTQGDSH